MAYNFPNAPNVGDTFQPAAGQPVYKWDGEKWTAVSSPAGVPVGIVFPFAGRPAGNFVISAPIVFTLSVASGLAGSYAYANVAPTADATFTFNKISGGSTTAFGTVKILAGSKTSFTLNGAGGALAIGDILQVLAPSTSDTSMSDPAITILAVRT
jgi:hypothetical protein